MRKTQLNFQNQRQILKKELLLKLLFLTTGEVKNYSLDYTLFCLFYSDFFNMF